MNYTKPTKFELMRQGRERAEAATAEFGWAPLDKVPVEQRNPNAPAVRIVQYAAPAPVVPTMEIDGVKYIEAPANKHNDCTGCAGEKNGPLCDRLLDAAQDARPGEGCATRRVVYIRAE